jgi:hypothetical protein
MIPAIVDALAKISWSQNKIFPSSGGSAVTSLEVPRASAAVIDRCLNDASPAELFKNLQRGFDRSRAFYCGFLVGLCGSDDTASDRSQC